MKKLFATFVIFFTLCSMAFTDNIVAKEYFQIENLENINIDLTFENIEIKTITGSEILVEISSNYSKIIPEVSTSNNSFSIKSKKKNLSSFGNFCTVYVYIPSTFFPKNTNIFTTSGNIYLEDLETDDLVISTKSGNSKVVLSKINNKINISSHSGKTSIDTTTSTIFTTLSLSGNIEIENLSAQEIICQSSNGKIEAAKLACEYLNLQSSSGTIEANNTKCEYFDLDSKSGSVKLQLENQIEAESSIKTTSGKINLIVPEDMNFQITANSSSGTFYDKITNNTYKPKHNFNLKFNELGIEIFLDTTSGSIILEN